MKTKVFTLTAMIFLLFIAKIFAQDVDSKLLVKYDKEYLDELKADNSIQYDLLLHFVEKGWSISEMPDKAIPHQNLKRINPKNGELSENQNISLLDLEEFNPLEFNIDFETPKGAYYKVGDTGKIIIVSSKEDIENSVKNKRRIRELNLKH